RNECQQQQHERQVKPRERSRVGVGEGGKGGAAEDHQPNLVPVPDRPYGIEENPPLGVIADQQMQHTDAEIEAIQNRIPRQEDSQEHEPDQRQVHGYSSALVLASVIEYGALRPSRAAASSSPSAVVVSGAPGTLSGPCLILLLST